MNKDGEKVQKALGTIQGNTVASRTGIFCSGSLKGSMKSERKATGSLELNSFFGHPVYVHKLPSQSTVLELFAVQYPTGK